MFSTPPAFVQTTVSTGPSASVGIANGDSDEEDGGPKRGTRAYRERERRDREKYHASHASHGSGEMGVKVEQSVDQHSSH